MESSPVVLAAFLFVTKPPVPLLVLIPTKKNYTQNVIFPQFQLSLEQFLSFPLLAVCAWYWWTQIIPRPNVKWEITIVVLLKLLVVGCNFLYNQQNDADKRKKIINKQIAFFIILVILWLLSVVFALIGSTRDSNHHPWFASFLFTIYLFLFFAFQFDFIHLENEISFKL
jgi:cell division protein FtsW (lipid II flippase)